MADPKIDDALLDKVYEKLKPQVAEFCRLMLVSPGTKAETKADAKRDGRATPRSAKEVASVVVMELIENVYKEAAQAGYRMGHRGGVVSWADAKFPTAADRQLTTVDWQVYAQLCDAEADRWEQRDIELRGSDPARTEIALGYKNRVTFYRGLRDKAIAREEALRAGRVMP